MLKVWTRDILHKLVVSEYAGYKFIVVSNREPFQHRRTAEGIECVQPAGGLVSALDPVMKACGGLWVAHGSGNADAATVDLHDHIAVPPSDPRYTLRRVWLSKEEEEGYYGGLANQGLWPLCHMAFTRPTFDPAHWDMYRRVNQRFADAVLAEAGEEPTFVFIQDYHFGLLPRLLRNARSNLVIAQFWHIPWPNREVFNSFPWKEEILDGLLGNDLLGFHLNHHCQNFLDTIDCALEAKIDRGASEITRGGQGTQVRSFPIGINFDEHVTRAQSNQVAALMEGWVQKLSCRGMKLGIGIDRLDYTKGIPERLRAFDRLLDQSPEYRGRLMFAQIAVPSRSELPAYRQIEEEVDLLVQKINQRWSTATWRPVVLLKQHYNAAQMTALHRLADFCVVTALHDGMNLVAKEFAASRCDDDGVLVLSKFTGAARELRDALLINPFAIEEAADAYRSALEMTPDERCRRMRKMRAAVEGNNIYRWAGKFLIELAKIEFPDYAADSSEPEEPDPPYFNRRAPYDGRSLGVAV